MSDADFRATVIEAARHLINATREGEVDGEAVAREVGREADDMDVYYALRQADRDGALDVSSWRGGMGLPHRVRLPRA